MSSAGLGVHYDFSHNYEVKVLESYSLLNPAEQLHQYPARLEEDDRKGIYLRVSAEDSPSWVGFFARGFDAAQVANGIYSCPEAGALCAVVGGYAYVVAARNPERWQQIEQRPVVQVRSVPELQRLLFVGFTSITALEESGRLWTTERLSWEGLTISEIRGAKLLGMGWDMMTDREVPFEVDLVTGKAKGGARPSSA